MNSSDRGEDEATKPEIHVAFEKRGVSLALLESLRSEALRLNPDEEFWSIARISAVLNGHYEILDPKSRWGLVDPSTTLTYDDQCSLIDLLMKKHHVDPHPVLKVTYGEVVGRATVFLSVAYQSNYIELIDAIRRHMDENPHLSSKSTYFWFSVLVNDQWRAFERDFDWWATTFREAVEEIGYTLCFFSSWDQPSYITRVWCLFELSCSTKSLEIALSGEQLLAFRNTLRRDYQRIVASLCVLDLEKAESYNSKDKQRIFEVIQAKGGFHKFNITLAGLLREWIAKATRKLIAERDSQIEGERHEGAAKCDDHVTHTIATHTEMLNDLIRSANLLHAQGMLDEAAAIFERALTGYTSHLGPEDPLTLSAMNTYANLLVEKGEVKEARLMFERSLKGHLNTLGSEDPVTLHTFNNLAGLLSDLGHLDEAKVMYDRALAGYEATLGPLDQYTLNTVNNIANLYVRQGRLADAKPLFDRAISGYEATVGPEHPSTLLAVNNLANVLFEQGSLDEARAMCDRVIMGREKTLGLDHPDTLRSCVTLGVLLGRQGHLAEAQAMLERVVGGFEKVATNHIDTLTALYNLGNMLVQQAKVDEALPMYERALGGFQATLVADHPNTLNTMNCLAKIFLQRRELEQAHSMFQQVAEGKRRSLGVDHPSTLFTMREIEALKRAILVEAHAADLPGEVSHSSHAHPLTLVAQAYAHGSYGCDICTTKGCGWAYRCGDCGYDCHPHCVVRFPEGN